MKAENDDLFLDLYVNFAALFCTSTVYVLGTCLCEYEPGYLVSSNSICALEGGFVVRVLLTFSFRFNN